MEKKKTKHGAKELKECQKLQAEYLDGWKRARADLLNFKKEEAERMKEFVRMTQEDFLLKVLPALDSFEVAEKQVPEHLREDTYLKGIFHIKAQLGDILKNQGIEEISTIGKMFDPHIHEVVQEIEAKDGESGIVIEEVQKGYMFQGKIMRVARVKITK